MELLAQEYYKIMDVISSYDSHLMAIKGWSITVGLALVGYAFQQKNKSILILCFISAICFALVNAKFKQYQTNYYPRMQAIEACMENEARSCSALQVNKSWELSNEHNSYLLHFLKAGVLMPHFILLALSILLYIVPGVIKRGSQLDNNEVRLD